MNSLIQQLNSCEIVVPKEATAIVHEITDSKIENERKWFLTKITKGTAECEVWLPEHIVPNAEVIMRYYSKCSLSASKPSVSMKMKMEELYYFFSQCNNMEMDTLVKSFITNDGIKMPPSSMKDVRNDIKTLIQDSSKLANPSFINELHRKVMIEEMLKRRTQQLIDLKRFETTINAVSDMLRPIQVVNEVDLETLPEDFCYTNEYVAGNDVFIPDEPPIGCTCLHACYRSDDCCPHQYNLRFAYDKNRRITSAPNVPVYECNRKCLCDSSCVNRVVQNPSTVSLLLFRTSNDCGWGVKTLKFIPKGTYVARYTGEVIRWKEAERRASVNPLVTEYLFDLDFAGCGEAGAGPDGAGEACRYTVDALRLGSVARFVNHSCEPNLNVHSVWVHCLDPNLHHIALFASRNIQAGEQLTFDYSRPMKPYCRCNSKRCRQ